MAENLNTETNTTAAAVEVVRTSRNFRNNADIESFYRFVNENDLRKEAKQLLEKVFSQVMGVAKKKKAKENRANKKNLQ